MTQDNPYHSPSAAVLVDPQQRQWKGGADAVLAARGLLRRRVIVHRPVEVTIEYFARGMTDRIIVDGKTVVSLVPVLWFHSRFDFDIPYCDGSLPASVRIKHARWSVRVERFEIEINGVVAYREENGQQQWREDVA